MFLSCASVLSVGLLGWVSSIDSASTHRADLLDQAKPVPLEITVYAAASMRESLTEIASEYDKQNGTKIVFNFGSSGDLARQIIAANKADLFISADEKEMDKVAAEKLLDESTRHVLLSNQLVVIEPFDPKDPERSLFTKPFNVEELGSTAIQRLSLANTDTVPAGRYAKAWLEQKDGWTRVKDRVLPGVDVRAALAAVESGGAQAGIVYKTDAALSKKVRVVYAVPLPQGPAIAYPLAVIKDRPRSTDAKRFAEYLDGASARNVFERFGFVVHERARPIEKPIEKR